MSHWQQLNSPFDFAADLDHDLDQAIFEHCRIAAMVSENLAGSAALADVSVSTCFNFIMRRKVVFLFFRFSMYKTS